MAFPASTEILSRVLDQIAQVMLSVKAASLAGLRTQLDALIATIA